MSSFSLSYGFANNQTIVLIAIPIIVLIESNRWIRLTIHRYREGFKKTREIIDSRIFITTEPPSKTLAYWKRFGMEHMQVNENEYNLLHPNCGRIWNYTDEGEQRHLNRLALIDIADRLVI